jgi:hypothetical protein
MFIITMEPGEYHYMMNVFGNGTSEERSALIESWIDKDEVPARLANISSAGDAELILKDVMRYLLVTSPKFNEYIVRAARINLHSNEAIIRYAKELGCDIELLLSTAASMLFTPKDDQANVETAGKGRECNTLVGFISLLIHALKQCSKIERNGLLGRIGLSPESFQCILDDKATYDEVGMLIHSGLDMERYIQPLADAWVNKLHEKAVSWPDIAGLNALSLCCYKMPLTISFPQACRENYLFEDKDALVEALHNQLVVRDFPIGEWMAIINTPSEWSTIMDDTNNAVSSYVPQGVEPLYAENVVVDLIEVVAAHHGDSLQQALTYDLHEDAKSAVLRRILK